MQQEKDQTQQSDLHALEIFVVQGCTESDASANLLKQLCCKYPYHFIKFMKKHGRLSVAADASLLTQCFIVAVHLTDGHYRKLQRYLAWPPTCALEVKEMERAVAVVELLILKQIREN